MRSIQIKRAVPRIFIPRIQTIPKAIKSGNVFQWQKHWGPYHRYNQEWAKILVFYFPMRDGSDRETQRRKIILTSFRPRILDEANLISGSKPIPDYLKRAGWIVDDDPKHVEIEYIQKKSREHFTTINIQ